jgi:hypothetical protein
MPYLSTSYASFFYLPRITSHARSIIYAPTYHSNHVCMWKLFSLIPHHSLTIQTTASRRRLSCMPPLSPTLNTGAPVSATRPREPTWASFNIRSPGLPLYLPYIYIQNHRLRVHCRKCRTTHTRQIALIHIYIYTCS